MKFIGKKFFSFNRDGKKYVSGEDAIIDVPYEYKDVIMAYGFVPLIEDGFDGKRKTPTDFDTLVIESNGAKNAVTIEVGIEEESVIDKPQKGKSPKKKSASAKKPKKTAKK